MQTFLPYPSFKMSAKVLDYRRLGKQRVEVRQILNALEGRSRGWKNHPATRMWAGFVPALKLYFNEISAEWVRRGYQHTMGFYDVSHSDVTYPPWFGDPDFHASHRSNLLRKDKEHYQQYWSGPDDTPYVWPVNHS